MIDPECATAWKEILESAPHVLDDSDQQIFRLLVDGATFAEISAETGWNLDAVTIRCGHLVGRFAILLHGDRTVVNAVSRGALRPRPEEAVYALRLAAPVRPGVWRVKIGWTTEIVNRWASYQHSVPVEVEPLAWRKGNRATEAWLHRRLDSMRWRGRRGEWFDVPDAILADLLAEPGWTAWDPPFLRAERRRLKRDAEEIRRTQWMRAA